MSNGSVNNKTENLGGGLRHNKIFKQILSIGYEFETSDIAKLSLHSNQKTLVNSDIAPRVLKERMERKSMKKINDNYFSVRIPIGSHIDTSDKIEDEDMNMNLDEMDEDEREYWEEFQREREQEKLERKENESYLDYFYENRETDDKNAVSFQITNDIADSDFGEMIKGFCQGLSIPKNDMFFFKTRAGKTFDIKFSEEIATHDVCETFSGVEYVITYYSPKTENENIVSDTFIDACSRIIDHLGNLEKIKGSLLITDDSKTNFTTMGLIGDDRGLYHKPHTNLFYIDIYDNDETKKLQGLGDIRFTPQMTFRSKAVHTLDIMKEIVRVDPTQRKSKKTIKDIAYEYTITTHIEDIVDEMFEEYNKTAKNPISTKVKIGKTIKLYVYLIIYKIYMFVQNHKEIFSKQTYLKDFLTFSSRHSNFILYKRIKELLRQHYGVSEFKDVIKLFHQPSALKVIYDYEEEDNTGDKGKQTGEKEIEDDEDFDEDGNYKYDFDAFEKDIPSTDPNFGNPMFSLLSYFKFMEEKEEDWLRESKYDVFSTSFPLEKDEVLIENRYFSHEVVFYLRNMVDKNISKNKTYGERTLSVREMHNVVYALYGDKLNQMMNLEADPYKKRLTRKCDVGYSRNSKFECVLTKKVRPVKPSPNPNPVNPVKTVTVGKQARKTKKSLPRSVL